MLARVAHDGREVPHIGNGSAALEPKGAAQVLVLPAQVLVLPAQVVAARMVEHAAQPLVVSRSRERTSLFPATAELGAALGVLGPDVAERYVDIVHGQAGALSLGRQVAAERSKDLLVK